MQFMSQFNCSDVWGIGRQTTKKLASYRIKTAADFMRKDDIWLKTNFGVTTMYCSWELNGHPVYSLVSDKKPPKSIMVSRSFGVPLKTFDDILDPLLCFTVSAARQLRKANQAAKKITVFIATNRFETENYYSNSKDIYFDEPRFLDVDLMLSAKEALGTIFLGNRDYKKCGIILSELCDTSCGIQSSLFFDRDDKKEAITKTVDNINAETLSSLMKPALLFNPPNEEKRWTPRSEFRSDPDSSKKNSPLPDGLRFQCHANDLTE